MATKAATRSPRAQTRDTSREPVTLKEQIRKERVPLGVARTKLSAPQIPGHVTRWINDDGGRLQNASDGGYSHVINPNLRVGQDEGQSQADSRVSKIVGKDAEGRSLRAYLMKIPQDLYERDQRSKQATLDETARAIREGSLVADGAEHRYTAGISVKSETIARSKPAEDDEED